MLIVWKGLGFMVPVQLLLAAMACQALTDVFLGDGFYKGNEWPKALAVVTASMSLLPVGMWLNGRKPEAIDPATGEIPEAQPAAHTFFVLPYQYWTWIALAFWAVTLGIG